ncbi:aladin [Mobula birostris]|uniref:aladin n=1 Tax=Mobula birostris TaxID=1983395 RepID=UPI003B281082
MISLALFPPPTCGVTLYELNNELVTGTQSDEDLHNFHTQDLGFAPVTIHRECLKPHGRSEHSAKAAFLSHSEPVWKRSANAWHDSGIYELLEEVNRSADEVPHVLRTVSGFALTLCHWVSSLYGSLSPHLRLSTEELLAQFTQVTDWKEGCLRAFAWHPHTNKCALALLDDSIRIYRGGSDTVPTLKHRLQRSVACVSWKPLCASVLAAGCESGVLVWNVDPNSLSTRPSSGCAQVLTHPGHSPVTSIAWCPRGDLLVTASPLDTSMLVWDVATESCVPLQRVGGGGVTFLAWSPDSSRILAATPSAVFRVWETRTWTCDRWPTLKGRCQTGCWSPDGSRLLFTVEGESVIYLLTFVDTGEVLGAGGSSKMASICADLSRTTLVGMGDKISVGGEVQTMVWDPSGERLAVLLKGDPSSPRCQPTIAVFRTRIRPVFELLPCGFIHNGSDSFPQFISFHPNFAKGALLTVGWSSGRISHIPFYFVKGQSYRTGSVCGAVLGSAQPRSPTDLFSEL